MQLRARARTSMYKVLGLFRSTAPPEATGVSVCVYIYTHTHASLLRAFEVLDSPPDIHLFHFMRNVAGPGTWAIYCKHSPCLANLVRPVSHSQVGYRKRASCETEASRVFKHQKTSVWE